jgi:porphobilinogen synthase
MYQRFRDRRIDRPARLRYQETFLRRDDFILPLFIVEGRGVTQTIPSMPGVLRFSADEAVEYIKPIINIGLHSVILFGVPGKKGLEQAWAENGLIQQSIPRLKDIYPQLEVMTDVCICSYSGDGQCHIGDNDRTCELIAKIAGSHAIVGADAVAPSDMMDGRVFHIRRELERIGKAGVPVISYAAKYASNFYGPFRDAAGSAPKHGDRKSYQMNPPNSAEALEEIRADIDEGAAQIIIKPALPYLDIVCRARTEFNIPLIAYNVSGEYAMIHALMEKGLAKEDIIYETLVSIKRAGANRIITYHTPWALEKLDVYQSL